ncbi:DUF2806 domain-containing protein [Rhodobacter capsulatus]|uniref:DUF2806 domain-containing protein n=1 Tax=Rhodobacter capsulatus TaxID=1061 RepID=UPI0040298712
MSNEIKIPGQELEQAAANTLEHAGKGLFDQLRQMFGDLWAKTAARRQAEALEITKDIAQRGQLNRMREVLAEQRKYELLSLEHAEELRAKQQELAEAARRRIVSEMAHEQAKIEHIALEAVSYSQLTNDSLGERFVEEDWLLRFFKYAAQVDEASVLDVLSKALAESAMASKPRISNRALDSLRFFDQRMKSDFEFIAQKIAVFGFLHRDHRFGAGEDSKSLDDFAGLFENGLLKVTRQRHINVDFGHTDVLFSYEPGTTNEFEIVKLTQLGAEIFGLFDERFRQFQHAKLTQDRAAWASLQAAFGLTSEFSSYLANTTIAYTSDSVGLGVTVLVAQGAAKSAVFDRVKPPNGGPYGIPANVPTEYLSQGERETLTSFLEQFLHFDQRASTSLQGRNE